MIQAGTIVGHKYRLEGPIGQGGMATIWRAVHTTLDRPVAVKFLEAVGTSAQELAARFLNEAKLAAGLRHRHVVDILDFGVLDGGQPYMVMELLEGMSLAERYEEGPSVSDWELLEVVAMTLSGLAAVHEAGILHRDVKPENIFLVHDADGIYPKLLDFGVSKGFDMGGKLTRTGSVVGTPQYMSPEQARGKRDVDPRSDLWSVGIVLYEGFAGELPFDSENPGDVLISVATEEPQSLSVHRPDLPESVIALVHRALAKKPDDRFSDARAMRDEVLAILERGEAVSGRPDSALIRVAYNTGAGTGKLKALTSSVTPPPPPGQSLPDPFVPLGAPPVPKEAVALAGDALHAGSFGTSQPPSPPKRRWLAPLVAVLVLGVGAGAFFAFDGKQLLVRSGLVPGESAHADTGAAGDVLPGVEVVALDPDAPDDVPLEPPPSDGVDAPPSETVDVPSPPDPPEVVEEAALGAIAEPAEEAVVEEAAPAPEPRRRRRRRRR
ncbi:MAG: serine/threonine-protein kinase [Sandaracinaceae bacterium]